MIEAMMSSEVMMGGCVSMISSAGREQVPAGDNEGEGDKCGKES